MKRPLVQIDLIDVLICVAAWALFCLIGCAPEQPCEATDAIGEESTPSAGEPDGPIAAVAPSFAPAIEKPQRGLWLEGLPVKATQQACMLWSYTGISCDVAESQETAWITLHLDATDCEPNDEGTTWYGSGQWRETWIHLPCFRDAVDTDENMHALYVAAVAHEIGHALGLGHLSDPGALMYPRMTYNREVTDADRAEFTRVWGELSPP